MNIQRRFQELTDRIRSGSSGCQEIDEEKIWGTHGPVIWHAGRASLSPTFYPVYRWQDLYSYSLLALILAKGRLRLNPRAVAAADRPGFLYLAGHDTIDLDIVRLGGPHTVGFEIQEVDEYARRIADALRGDAAAAEERHPGYTNVVLCGGKDSLNLLLLPWKNPVTAFSAEPNFELVREFARRNDLPINVQRLEDPQDAQVQDEEALVAACRADLAHWRWGGHLRRIAQDHGHKAIFWKGQVADLYTTPKWKAFVVPPRKREVVPRKIYKKLSPILPMPVHRMVGRRLQPRVVQATWDRCAVLQGCHMGFLRELTGCLFLSAYHGPRMMEVWSQADLASVAQVDMRDQVALELHGRKVMYPERNPAPPVSAFRAGLGRPGRFLGLLERLHFPFDRAV